MTSRNEQPLLRIDDLCVELGRADARSRVLEGVSLEVHAGERVAVVGESGSGKSVTALSVLRLHEPAQVAYTRGSIEFAGKDLLRLPEAQMRAVRGRDIAMIFQEPMNSLNPVYPIGSQLVEALTLHEEVSKPAARRRMIELLARTGIDEPERRFDAFPHMLSGGQRQRVMIAMALACRPRLLIADEPTTALDVTIQAQILELLEDLQREFGMAVMMITHDLNLVRRFADRICVMQGGRVVEVAPTQQLFDAPAHDYTRQLLASEPVRLIGPAPAAASALLSVSDLDCRFPIRGGGLWRRRVGEVVAVDRASLELRPGETLGIVGESGSGKTTLGMCLLRLQAATGDIVFDGQPLHRLQGQPLRRLRRHLQVVFQDPFASLSPRMNVEQIVGEGLRIHYPQLDAAQRRERIVGVLQEVGLGEEALWRYPHEFSGGQRQRIAIARVVVLEPRLILLDEPTSALDVSVQKQVLALLERLQRRHGLSYLFISHDLKVIRAVAHRVLVMRGGRIVEQGDTEQLFCAPRHPYTKALLEASLFAAAG